MSRGLSVKIELDIFSVRITSMPCFFQDLLLPMTALPQRLLLLALPLTV